MVCLSFCTFAQSTSELQKHRIFDWDKAGLIEGIPLHKKSNIFNINDFHRNDSTYDKAFVAALNSKDPDLIQIIYFPAGEYKFSKPINLISNTVLRGDGSENTHLIFNFSKEKGNVITFSGKSKKTLTYNSSLSKGISEIELNENIESYSNCDVVEIYQGKNEWGKSSSGKEKQYQVGQLLSVKKINANNVSLIQPIKLNYKDKDKWGEPINIRLIESVSNSGIENLSIQRTDKPPRNGGNIVSFNFAKNCWISGVESIMGANNHISVSHSLNIEIRGSYFNNAFDTGGGGNGYGIVVGGNASDCLFEDNIFAELRHAMIIASGANGNVFGYNASFYKPILNIDEASISVHGHYPYMNLFEGNYVEYINVDYVWGANGEYNTFLRNYVYHTGVFGLFRNQELQVERGNDKTNIIGNLANIYARGNDNFILKNMTIDKLNTSMFLETFSFYYDEKPKFISDDISWPCFGLKTSEDGEMISNTIPAVMRFKSGLKTVPAKALLDEAYDKPKTKTLIDLKSSKN